MAFWHGVRLYADVWCASNASSVLLITLTELFRYCYYRQKRCRFAESHTGCCCLILLDKVRSVHAHIPQTYYASALLLHHFFDYSCCRHVSHCHCSHLPFPFHLMVQPCCMYDHQLYLVAVSLDTVRGLLDVICLLCPP